MNQQIQNKKNREWVVIENCWPLLDKASIYSQEKIYEDFFDSILSQTVSNEDYNEVFKDVILQRAFDTNRRLSNPLPEENIKNIFSEVKESALLNYKREKKERKEYLENNKDRLVTVKSSSVISKPIQWLWPNKIAKGKLTIIAGDPGLGKSQVSIDIGAIVTTGGLWPSGERAEKGSILLLSAEDDISDTINPRFIVAGADLDKIDIFTIALRDGKEKGFMLDTDIDLIENYLEINEDISLIIVDPITAFLGETDSHKNAEVRALLSRLSKLANKYKVAILAVTHLNKNSTGSPINKISGSLAFAAAARAVYMIVKDEQDEGRRLFLTIKNNLAEDKYGFAYSVKAEEIKKEGEEIIKTSRVVWETEKISLSALEVLREQDERGKGVAKNTIQWVERYLQSRPEGVEVSHLVRVASKNNISRSTLYRALKEAWVEPIKEGRNVVWKYAGDFKNDEDINPAEVPI